MAIVLPGRNKFEGLAQALQGLIQGQEAKFQRERRASELSSVNNFLGNPAASQPLGQGQQGPVRGAPQVMDPFVQQVLTQGLQNQRTQEAVARQNLAVQQAKVPTTKTQVIQDPNNPGGFLQVLMDNAGNVIKNLGPATPKQVKEGVAPEAVQSSTKTKLEKDIVDIEGTLGELGEINKSFDPDFLLTFDVKNPLGNSKIAAAITAKAEKFGLEPSEARTEFLDSRTKFFADSKRVFLKFRKFITGVAGGIQEFREIAKSTIDPESDSPTQFQAKMKSMTENATRLNILMRRVRDKGFEPNEDNIRAEIRNAGGIENIQIESDTQSQEEQPQDAVGFSNDLRAGLAGVGPFTGQQGPNTQQSAIPETKNNVDSISESFGF